MRIAILGATSQISKDLVMSLSACGTDELHLFARRVDAVKEWLAGAGLSDRHVAADFEAFSISEHFDAVINFVGVGNPAQAVKIGPSIIDITQKFDDLALNYVRYHRGCRYLFLSSGAAYGANFDAPVSEDSHSIVAINRLMPQDWYSIAKLYAECRHRSHSDLPIVDIRVFSYFSRTQDIAARFLISDIIRAVDAGETLSTSAENIVRDYLGPADFAQLVRLILAAPPVNDAVDCYTKAPVDKFALLSAMQERFGLAWQVQEAPVGVNATGAKLNYYSNNRRAERFGYSPTKGALESVLDEAALIISSGAR